MKHIPALKPALLGLLVATGLAADAPAFADDASGYVGAGLGGSHFDSSIDGVQSGSNTGLNGNVYGGYQFDKYFAVEAGYADLGHSDDADPSRASAHAGYVDAVGLLPVGDDVSLLADAGVDRAKLTTTNGDADGDGLKLGVGAEYALSPNIALRGEMDRYQVHAFGEDPAIKQYTVGLRVKF